MTFVENEQYVVAFFSQNEVRAIEAGNEAEIALKTYPGQIIKCEVESVRPAMAQGQLPISGQLPNTGFGVAPDMRLAVKLKVTGEDAKLFLAPGARGHGAVYTNSGAMIHILRKIILRVGAKVDWLILKMHRLRRAPDTPHSHSQSPRCSVVARSSRRPTRRRSAPTRCTAPSSALTGPPTRRLRARSATTGSPPSMTSSWTSSSSKRSNATPICASLRRRSSNCSLMPISRRRNCCRR